jgi:hypothetical protein
MQEQPGRNHRNTAETRKIDGKMVDIKYNAKQAVARREIAIAED